MIQRVTTSGGASVNERQQMTASNKKIKVSNSELQGVIKRMNTNESK